LLIAGANTKLADVIEVERTGASAKFDALRRAQLRRRTAHARADVECSNRTGVRRDRNRSVTMPASAIVSARGSCQRSPRTVAQAEPTPVTITEPCPLAPLPMLAATAVILVTFHRLRSCAGAKTADIEPRLFR
jgi:hypothetical protein